MASSKGSFGSTSATKLRFAVAKAVNSSPFSSAFCAARRAVGLNSSTLSTRGSAFCSRGLYTVSGSSSISGCGGRRLRAHQLARARVVHDIMPRLQMRGRIGEDRVDDLVADGRIGRRDLRLRVIQRRNRSVGRSGSADRRELARAAIHCVRRDRCKTTGFLCGRCGRFLSRLFRRTIDRYRFIVLRHGRERGRLFSGAAGL